MRTIICFLFALLGFISSVYGQNREYNVYSDWTYSGDVSNNLYRQLRSVAFMQLESRQLVVKNLKTQEDWINYQRKVQEKLKVMFGPFPDKTPLNPVITGKIAKEDYTIEKLRFESRPNYHVTAMMFIPKKIKGKAPAILYCCGHSENGFRSTGYQYSILNLVKKGFIVLAFDPIGQGERIQYFKPDGSAVYGSTHEHSYPGAQSFISGVSPASYFVWDGIRAIDYLTTRKEVDVKRIGVTGRSGGGTQSAYIASIDDRVVAAAPECYITSFEMLLRSRGPQDAEQNLMYSLAEGIDMCDLIIARAPKPTLMVTTTSDIFNIQGARNVFKEASVAFAALQSPNELLMVEDDAGHASTQKNREATHAFFQKYLNNPGSPDDIDVPLFDEQELWVTSSGQIQKDIPSETIFSLNAQYTKSLLEKKKQDDSPGSIRNKAIMISGYEKKAIREDYIFSGRLQKEGYNVEKFLIKGSGDYYIPLLRLVPLAVRKGNVLLLDEQGKATAAADNGVINLVRQGYEIVIPDLTGIGELCGGYKAGDAIIQGVPLNVWFAGILTKKSPLGLRVEEIEIVNHFMKHIGNDSQKCIGIAKGTLCADMMHANVVTDAFERIALINPLSSYSSIVFDRDYNTKYIMSAMAGVLKEYDLPDLLKAGKGEKILMINPVNAQEKAVEINTFNQLYEGVMQSFRQKGIPERFSVEFNQPDPYAKIHSWIL